MTLALAFLAPKHASAVAYFEDITTTNLPSPQPCADTKEGCYTSWLTSSDIDGDGDLDVVMANGGGYYALGNAEESTVYLNDGLGNFVDGTPSMFGGAVSRLRQVAIGDVDGDGDLDMLAPGGYAADLDKLWIQTAPGVFEDRAAQLLPPGQQSNTPGFHLGDLDGDGDLDFVSADWGDAQPNNPVILTLYLNDGSGKFEPVATQLDPRLAEPTDRLPPVIPWAASQGYLYWGSRAIDIDFSDIDGDFDLDILVNMRNGISRILLNDGHAYFRDGNGKISIKTNPDGTTTVVSNYPQKRGPYVYNQELCDFDKDGDLDLLLDNAGARPTGGSSNYSQVLVNDGSGVFADETRARIFGETGSDDNAVKCVDVNNDGNYDLLVASLTGAAEKLLISDGAGKFNAEAGGFPAVRDNTLGIDAADFDGDGIFDVVTGQGEGNGTYIDRLYRGIGPSLKDTLAPKFRKLETPVAYEGQPIVFRVAVTDSVTSETGEMVKDVSVVYLANKASGKVKAKFIGGDLFRAVIPAQPAYTTVTLTPQAVDRGGNKGFGTPVSVFVLPVPVVGGEGGAGGEPPASGGGGEPPAEGGAGGAPVAEGGAPGEMEPGEMEPGEMEPPAGGTPGEEPARGESGSGATTSGTSGSSATSGGSSSNAGGVPSGQAGSSDDPRSGGDDDGGCTVTSSPSSPHVGGWLAATSLLLVGLMRRRRSR